MNTARSPFLEFEMPTHVFAARCPHCNETVGCIVDTPAIAVEVKRDTLRWKREGLIVERIERTTALARLNRCTCADTRKAARNG
jgi:hypothetical protein